MVNDPIADFVVRLKNGGLVAKASVCVPYSKLKHAIADKLVAASYIAGVATQGKQTKKELVVTLKYNENGTHRIRGVRRVSKPGRRWYVKAAGIVPFKSGHGTRILSTPAGILTGEEARRKNIGGEELFVIW